MCGRYHFYDGNNPVIRKLIDQAKAALPEKEFEEISLFEVFPSQKCFAGYWNPQKKDVRTTVMKWGYSGFNGRQIINARSETCFKSRFFAGSHPCAVPACGYYEWSENPRVKYEFTVEKEPFYLAGIFHKEQNGLHFVILTEEAGEPQRQIHSRQPLLLSYENARKWCASEHPASLRALSIQNRIIRKA